MLLKSLLISLFLMTHLCYGQCNFRIKPVSVTIHDAVNHDTTFTEAFLLPPKAKIANEGFIFHKQFLEYKISPRFKYQYVLIKGINSNYFTSIQALKKATLIQKNLFSSSVKSVKKKYQLNSNGTIGAFVTYYISSNCDNVLFQINYEKLLNDFKNFYQYKKELFEGVSDLEETYSKTPHPWAQSITQDIVQKIYELTPIPEKSALDQYLVFIDDFKSSVILNPKVWIAVDNVEKVNSKIFNSGEDNGVRTEYNKFWNYNLNGQTIIKFYRDNDGNLSQSPFLRFSIQDPHILPTNILNSDNNPDPKKNEPYAGNLLASSADIQLSANIKGSKFIYLFQDDFKANNQKSGSKDLSADNSFTSENSVLLFYDKIDSKFIDAIDTKNPDPYSISGCKYGVFGMRNLITPIVPVYVNNLLQTVVLNSTVNIAKQQGLIPDLHKLIISRIYNGYYKKILVTKKNILLIENCLILPGDSFKFKRGHL